MAVDDLKLTITSNTEKVEIGFLYLCPFVPPFIDELNEICKIKMTITSGDVLLIHDSDKHHYIGTNYIVIHNNAPNVNIIKIATEVNKNILLSKM